MRAALLTEDAALAALAPEWEALWHRAAALPNGSGGGPAGGPAGSPAGNPVTPFQSPAWLLPWWEAFGTGQPRVALLRGADGALLGVLPLYRLDEASERKLLPFGVGITDHNDALLAPEAPAGAASLLLGTALEHAARDGVTSCDLPDLKPDALLRDAASPAGWREERWDGEPCPVLQLPADPAALRDAVPSNTLRKLRMARHRAERIGGWRTEIAGPETRDVVWEALVGMHQARWTARGETGVLADPRVLAFHRAALPRLAAAGVLRLYALRFGDRIVAAYHTLAAGPDRLMFYLSGFDAAHGFESPGTILLGDIIEQCIAEGRRELHFLRGREAYKQAWGGRDRANLGRRLVPPDRR